MSSSQAAPGSTTSAQRRVVSFMNSSWQPTEFGKMVKLQEAENQIVVAYEVYDQRPSDSDVLMAAIENTGAV